MWLPAWLNNKIKNNFGSQKGFLKYYYYQLLLMLGCFKKNDIANVCFKPKRYVFVCAGNICRSPLGEVAAAKAGVSAISFGLSTRGGDKADPRAIEFAKTKGLDLSKHMTTCIKKYKAIEGDILICMEPKHIAMFRAMDKTTPIVLVGLCLPKPIACLFDPYNTNPIAFTYCEIAVYNATLRLIQSRATR